MGFDKQVPHFENIWDSDNFQVLDQECGDPYIAQHAHKIVEVTVLDDLVPDMMRACEDEMTQKITLDETSHEKMDVLLQMEYTSRDMGESIGLLLHHVRRKLVEKYRGRDPGTRLPRGFTLADLESRIRLNLFLLTEENHGEGSRYTSLDFGSVLADIFGPTLCRDRDRGHRDLYLQEFGTMRAKTVVTIRGFAMACGMSRQGVHAIATPALGVLPLELGPGVNTFLSVYRDLVLRIGFPSEICAQILDFLGVGVTLNPSALCRREDVPILREVRENKIAGLGRNLSVLSHTEVATGRLQLPLALCNTHVPCTVDPHTISALADPFLFFDPSKYRTSNGWRSFRIRGTVLDFDNTVAPTDMTILESLRSAVASHWLSCHDVGESAERTAVCSAQKLDAFLRLLFRRSGDGSFDAEGDYLDLLGSRVFHNNLHDGMLDLGMYVLVHGLRSERHKHRNGTVGQIVNRKNAGGRYGIKCLRPDTAKQDDELLNEWISHRYGAGTKATAEHAANAESADPILLLPKNITVICHEGSSATGGEVQCHVSHMDSVGVVSRPHFDAKQIPPQWVFVETCGGLLLVPRRFTRKLGKPRVPPALLHQKRKLFFRLWAEEIFDDLSLIKGRGLKLECVVAALNRSYEQSLSRKIATCKLMPGAWELIVKLTRLQQRARTWSKLRERQEEIRRQLEELDPENFAQQHEWDSYDDSDDVDMEREALGTSKSPKTQRKIKLLQKQLDCLDREKLNYDEDEAPRSYWFLVSSVFSSEQLQNIFKSWKLDAVMSEDWESQQTDSGEGYISESAFDCIFGAFDGLDVTSCKAQQIVECDRIVKSRREHIPGMGLVEETLIVSGCWSGLVAASNLGVRLIEGIEAGARVTVGGMTIQEILSKSNAGSLSGVWMLGSEISTADHP